MRSVLFVNHQNFVLIWHYANVSWVENYWLYNQKFSIKLIFFKIFFSFLFCHNIMIIKISLLLKVYLKIEIKLFFYYSNVFEAEAFRLFNRN